MLCYYIILYSIIYVSHHHIYIYAYYVDLSINYSLWWPTPFTWPPYFNHPKNVFFPWKSLHVLPHPRPSENCIADLPRHEDIPPEIFDGFSVCCLNRVCYIFPLNITKKKVNHLYSYSKPLKVMLQKPPKKGMNEQYSKPCRRSVVWLLSSDFFRFDHQGVIHWSVISFCIFSGVIHPKVFC